MFINNKLSETYFNVFFLRVLYVFYRQRQNTYYAYGRTILRSPVLAALLHGTKVVEVSQTLRRRTEAPPIFGRAAITLGIGLHSSYYTLS